MTSLNPEVLVVNGTLIKFGEWGVATANELCDQSTPCQMAWVPTIESAETEVRQSLKFECKLAECAVLAWGLNASPESIALRLAEKQAANPPK